MNKIEDILKKYNLKYIIDNSELTPHIKYKIQYDDETLIIVTVIDGKDNFIYSIFKGKEREYFITDYRPLSLFEHFLEEFKKLKEK